MKFDEFDRPQWHESYTPPESKVKDGRIRGLVNFLVSKIAERFEVWESGSLQGSWLNPINNPAFVTAEETIIEHPESVIPDLPSN